MPKGFDIVGGKDLMRDVEIGRQRERTTGTRELTYGELQQNCDTLARWISSRVPGDVGFVLVLAPRDSVQSGVTASNTEIEHTERVLEKAVKRIRKRRTSGDGS